MLRARAKTKTSIKGEVREETMKLTYATRRSALALAQSRAFVAELRAKHSELEAVELTIVTSGDKNQESKLQDIGGKGLFIKELEEALYDRRADFAVHSIKDVPAELAPGLALSCVPKREDPRDALVTRDGKKLADLREGAVVGTSSLRRAVCLQAARPDLRIEQLRGNVDTRLKRVDEGKFDAVVLALAGLKRLGLEARATEALSAEVSLPAIGQGALGIETRAGDERAISALAAMHDPETAIAVAAERAFMAGVGGNCRMPVAAYARRSASGGMRIDALLADADGTKLRRTGRDVGWPSSEEEAITVGRGIAGELR
jgi:hydroxymethylbilane synthase